MLCMIWSMYRTNTDSKFDETIEKSGTLVHVDRNPSTTAIIQN